MGIVLKFPAKVDGGKKEVAAPARSTVKDDRINPVLAVLVTKVVHLLWIITLLVWPVLRWIIAIDVAFYGFMTALAWDTPDTHYGMKFTIHLLVFVALIYFVTQYKEKKPNFSR